MSSARSAIIEVPLILALIERVRVTTVFRKSRGRSNGSPGPGNTPSSRSMIGSGPMIPLRMAMERVAVFFPKRRDSTGARNTASREPR